MPLYPPNSYVGARTSKAMAFEDGPLEGDLSGWGGAPMMGLES